MSRKTSRIFGSPALTTATRPSNQTVEVKADAGAGRERTGDVPMNDTVVNAKCEKVNDIIGKGCFVQGIGLLAPIVLYAVAGLPGAAIGILPMLVLLIGGGRMAYSWRCGHCKNPVASNKVRICPVCKANLE